MGKKGWVRGWVPQGTHKPAKYDVGKTLRAFNTLGRAKKAVNVIPMGTATDWVSMGVKKLVGG